MVPRIRQYRRGRGRAVHKEGSPWCPSFLLPPFHSLGHSFFSTGKPEATGSYAPSSWLAFAERLFVATDDVPGTLHALGARFPLLEKFRGFARAFSFRRGQFRERLSEINKCFTRTLRRLSSRIQIKCVQIKTALVCNFNNLKSILQFCYFIFIILNYCSRCIFKIQLILYNRSNKKCFLDASIIYILHGTRRNAISKSFA